MERLGETTIFQARQNIILQGFDLVSAGGFTQLPNFILKNPKLSSSAKITYALLLSYAWHNDKVFPGQERLAEDMGAGRRSVIRFIAELEQSSYLEVKRRGQGLTNVYVLKYTVKQKKGKTPG